MNPNPHPHLSLGYAGPNLRLQERRDIRCNRSCHVATRKAVGGLKHAQGLALRNLCELVDIMQWNDAHDIRLCRLPSNLFPLASHPDPVCQYDLEFADECLELVGVAAQMYRQRLTIHPTVHHVLSSIDEQVTRDAQRGLEHHCDVLERMGMDQHSVIVIHGGGKFDDKTAALARLETNLRALPDNVRSRLVLENDELCYSVRDLLPISRRLLIPIVVDFHHDAILGSGQPIETLLPAVFQVWDARGIKPKVHVSQCEAGIGICKKRRRRETHYGSRRTRRPPAATVQERRRHGPYIDALPNALLHATRDIDVMFEARKQEGAVLRYRLLAAQGQGEGEEQGAASSSVASASGSGPAPAAAHAHCHAHAHAGPGPLSLHNVRLRKPRKKSRKPRWE